MSKKDDAERFVADATDMAIGIGPSGKLRFIGMGLYEQLKKTLSDDEIYKRLPANGRAAYTEAQLTN